MIRACIAVAFLAACASAPARPREQPALWEQRFVIHDGVRIEYRVRPGTGVPVVFVPGLSNPARDYEDNAPLVASLEARTIVAISIRGRGASDSPETGWTIAAQASDIDAVVESEHLRRYHLVGHSMGVGYALYHALSHPSQVASFTAADYRPGLPLVSEEWAANGAEKPRTERYDPSIKRRMLREQGAADWMPDLRAFAVPTLAILSTESSDRFVEDMWKAAPNVRVHWIEHGHQTFSSPEARALTAAHFTRVDRTGGR